MIEIVLIIRIVLNNLAKWYLSVMVVTTGKYPTNPLI